MIRSLSAQVQKPHPKPSRQQPLYSLLSHLHSSCCCLLPPLPLANLSIEGVKQRSLRRRPVMEDYQWLGDDTIVRETPFFYSTSLSQDQITPNERSPQQISLISSPHQHSTLKKRNYQKALSTFDKYLTGPTQQWMIFFSIIYK